jgi:hypothetical protein
MKKSAALTALTALAAGLCVSLSSFAQVPASAPASTTGLCKDGSFSSSATKKGACQGHKGVKTWYGATVSGTASPTAVTATGSQMASATTAAAATSGGGPGQVWVNNKTKVYHCPSDRFYGKTKEGEYLSEAAAKAAGDHPAHGKSCS